MSGLARLLAELGHQVSGSDVHDSATVAALRSAPQSTMTSPQVTVTASWRSCRESPWRLHATQLARRSRSRTRTGTRTQASRCACPEHPYALARPAVTRTSNPLGRETERVSWLLVGLAGCARPARSHAGPQSYRVGFDGIALTRGADSAAAHWPDAWPEGAYAAGMVTVT